MFKSLGLFSSLPCPVKGCKTSGCLFQHLRFPSPEPEPESERVVKRRRVDTPTSAIKDAAKSHRMSCPTGSRSVIATNLSPAEERLRNENSRVVCALSESPQAAASASLGTEAAVAPKESPPSVTASDSRYVSRVVQTPEITIRYDPMVPVPHESRLHYLRAYKIQFERIYAPISSHADFSKWVVEDSIAQEKSVLQRSGKGIYKQASRNMLIKLTKREPSQGVHDRGIFPEYKPPLPSPELGGLVHTPQVLKKAGFLTSIPEPDATMKNEEGQDRNCERCGQRFIVSANPGEWSSCTYHPGKSSRLGKSGVRARQWTCCTTEGPGCVVAKTHVFKVSHEPRLAAYHPFVMLPPGDAQSRAKVVAMDCEMVYTTASLELARAVFTDMAGTVLLDEYVSLENTILDLNSRFSGIQEGDLSEKGIDRAELFEKIKDLGIDRDTIMVGHGLENDLCALRIVHTQLIDSAILFPHKAGLPYRNALKYLVKRYLNKDIQMNPVNGTGAIGHDPAEDARSALELVLWKAVNGDKAVGDEPFAGKLK